MGAQGESPLLDNLIGYWDLSEASGNRADGHTNGITLTDVNTVGSTTGVGGSGAASDHVSANSERLDATNALINQGDGNAFSVCFWNKRDTGGSGNACVQYYQAAADRGWVADWTGSKYRLLVYSGTSIVATAQTAASYPADDTWHFVRCWYDPTVGANGTAYVSVDNAAASSAAASATLKAEDAALFSIGRWLVNQHIDGSFQACGVWHRVLTTAEAAWLYNSGSSARLYADLTAYTG